MILEEHNKVKLFFEEAAKKVTITDDRKALLSLIAQKIIELKKNTTSIYLNFICTHNSRRSQLAQIWSYFASYYFGIKIKSLSGGTSVTAFHRNTVTTLKKAGFKFEILEFNHQNPKYLIGFNGEKNRLLAFSKLYDDNTNDFPFIAITTCSSADENCPFIPTALERFHLPYTDPKEADNTENEAEAYLQTNQQIAAEVYFLFDSIKKA